MPLSKCPRTGKLFDSSKGAVHPSVEADEEADYVKILDFLAENPNAKANEIVEETGVSLECITRMVKAGRVREMDEKALKAQAEEEAERAAEIARRNQRVSTALSDALRHKPDVQSLSNTGQSGASTLRTKLHNIRDKT